MIDPEHIKNRIVDIANESNASHVASALSCVELLCKCYNDQPDAIIILSKGHGALAQYVILNELGKLPDEVLETYNKPDGLEIHPKLNTEYGIYASTGSLGHGLGIGIGYAIADPDRMVIVVLGDGELDEGSTYEQMKIILDLQIKNILPVVDRNDLQGFRETSNWFPSFFSKTDPTNTQGPYKVFYSVKGKDFGKKWEGKVDSHYLMLNDKIVKSWKKKQKKKS